MQPAHVRIIQRTARRIVANHRQAATQQKEANKMMPEQRAELIDQLDRSFAALPTWGKIAVKHSMGAPETNPKTGKVFTSFREVIEAASDETLEILREDFDGNGDLLPGVSRET